MKRGEREAEKEMELTSSLKTSQSREKEMERDNGEARKRSLFLGQKYIHENIYNKTNK